MYARPPVETHPTTAARARVPYTRRHNATTHGGRARIYDRRRRRVLGTRSPPRGPVSFTTAVFRPSEQYRFNAVSTVLERVRVRDEFSVRTAGGTLRL